MNDGLINIFVKYFCDESTMDDGMQSIANLHIFDGSHETAIDRHGNNRQRPIDHSLITHFKATRAGLILG